MEIDRSLRKQYRNRFSGKDVDVLIERNDETDSYGYSREYLYVRIPGIHPIGEIKKVHIKDTETEVLGYVAE